MKNLVPLMLLAIFAIPSFGQSISIFDIDATNFPKLKAKFYAIDENGKPYTPNISDMKLSENGIPRIITNISCPSLKLNSISAGIMVDTYKYIDLARVGTQKLIDFLQMPNDELGITYMASGVYIYQDFTKSKTKALDKASTIPSAPGVDINSMFNSPITGGMPFIKDRKNDKKVLILISDLHCPNLTIDENKLIDDAKANGISIYSILLGTIDYSKLFSRIANATGGSVFQRVSSENQITNIFQEISNNEHYEACEIEWEGDYNCNINVVNVDVSVFLDSAKITYKQPKFLNSEIKLERQVVSFGRVTPNTKTIKTLKISSNKADFVILNIKNVKGSNLIKINNKFPILVKKDEIYNIDIEYEQIDSNAEFALFEIETQNCSYNFTANGGYFEKKKNQQTLKLTYPNGGEKFIVGENESIKWEGVSQNDTVILHYSIDSGKTWNLLTDKATNLSYEWKNIPRPTSSSCLVKVSQVYDNSNGNNFEVLTLKGHQFEVRDFAITNDDLTLYSCDRGGIINIWDVKTGLKLDSLVHSNLNGNLIGGRIAINKSNSQLAVSSKESIFSFNIKDNIFMYQSLVSANSNESQGIDFSSDGKYIFTVLKNEQYKLFSTNGNIVSQQLNGRAHQSFPNSLFVFNNDSKLVSSGYDGYIKIWNFNDLSILNEIKINKSLTDLALSQNEEYFVTCTIDSTYYVVNANNYKFEKVNRNLFDNTISISISPDNEKIITGGTNSIIKIWDFETGLLLKELKGHKGTITRLKFTNNGSKIISGSNDNDIKIWDVDFGIAQSDISDSLFSIVAPEPRFNNLNIDMGQVIVGDSKDTMVTSVLCNTGEAPLHVLGVDVTSGDIANFMVPRGAGEFYLAPNECRAFMFAFMPNKLGPFSARITVKSTIGDFVDTINIIGVGIAPQIEVVNKLIDFGNVDLGTFKDTIQAVTIRNSGNVPINITNVKIDTLNDIDFAMLSNFVPFSINPGDTVKMDLRFTPRFIGRTSGILLFEFNGIDSPTKVELIGNGLGGNVLLKVGRAEEYAGKRIDIPITLIGNNKFLASGIKYINLELQFNKTILYPSQPNNISVKNGLKYIKLDSVPIVNVDFNQVIANLNFKTALGSTEETPINVTDYKLIGGDADLEVQHGNFKLLGVCFEGGERFLVGNKSKTMLLSISPNPATESIEIEYSNADEGTAEIIISNYLGQTILTQKLEKTQTGKTKLDLNQIPTGQYVIQFKTETVLENRMIQVIK